MAIQNYQLFVRCQDKNDVIQAVSDGYAAAFDILAPMAVLPFDSRTITGTKVAKILFPDADDDIAVLDKPVKIRSSYIGEEQSGCHSRHGLQKNARQGAGQWMRSSRTLMGC